ncbi:MAG: TIGR03619 family F420-dependent LLM class oxidoreductase, partial [Candidatus Lambdaproteobacteria bacterium]|nr:TIGR03619 family F420-dependent LLM class oxidoreductase [Candidatus Lambdaproteobacteria bacterium]
SLWLPEHLPIPVGRLTPPTGGGEMPEHYKHLLDPFVALAAAAGATERLRLGTGVCLVAERNPLLLAKELATLDLVSGGRVLFGIGAGWLREEAELYGADFPRRWAQTRDHVLAMKALWAADSAGYQGRYARFPEVWCHPKPVQRPHPPIFIAGELERVAERIAEYGDGWLPRGRGLGPGALEGGRKEIERRMRERGRHAARLDVTVFGAEAERAEVRRLAEAGATRVLHLFRPRPRAETLAHLEQVAEAVL